MHAVAQHRDCIQCQKRHGDAQAGKVAALAVFKGFASVMRALHALRKHLARSVGDYEPPDDAERG
jgi:hypothetical protein